MCALPIAVVLFSCAQPTDPSSSTPSGSTITTLVGTAGVTGNSDGTGTAARFNRPYGITTEGTNLYVADTENYTIRVATKQGQGRHTPLIAAALKTWPNDLVSKVEQKNK
jgi:hypothetical protein